MLAGSVCVNRDALVVTGYFIGVQDGSHGIEVQGGCVCGGDNPSLCRSKVS